MQEQTQLVSVLINTRNRDKLIPRAIQSALNQTYKNIEIVVVDGTSTDRTRDVVLEFNDDRIQYYYSENPGVSGCWQLGLSKCNGEYISLLDDDDEYLPQKIEKQVALLNTLDNSYGWVSCGGEYIDDVTGEVMQTLIPFLRGDIHEKLLENAGIGVNGGTTLMFRKDALLSEGSPIACIDYSTDFLLYLWLSKKHKFDYCEEILCIGHANHIYEHTRGSKLQSTAENFRKLIQWNHYILSTYQDTLSRHPSYKYVYYRNLALLYARLRKAKNALKYTFRSCIVSPGRFRKNATMLIKVLFAFVNSCEKP